MILCLSPHLDDAVFSAGAFVAESTAAGEAVLIATIFTATVPEPTGFALRCQTDKGYGPEVDYMALRRAEDVEACGIVGAEVEHWGFAEAPHRGYASAVELFAGVHDTAAEHYLVTALAERIEASVGTHRPSEVWYPAGAGDHVDHLVLIRAVDRMRASWPEVAWGQWYDQPYVARNPGVFAFAKTNIKSEASDASLARKWRACAAYASQVEYQFYGALGESRPPDADDAVRIAGVLGTREWLRPAG